MCGYVRSIKDEGIQQRVAILRILLATCLTTLDAFQAADNALDEEFRADLERIIDRTRRELDTLTTTR